MTDTQNSTWNTCAACDAVYHGAVCLKCQAEAWQRQARDEREAPVLFWSETLGCYVSIPEE